MCQQPGVIIFDFTTWGSVFTLYTVDATEYVTAQIDATFHEGREKWRTIISILQA